MNAETVMLLLLVIPIVVCLGVGVVLVIMTKPLQYTDEEEIKRMMEW